mmetsp:Transcript_72949/g.189439  ORF Transcript_72949/g.189439 Transcript_72949/m.189439 type:complete len:539 (+) Transcript_72949:204-1820(+)
MPVQFKFRGEKAFRSLLNVTTPCTLQRVKTAIYEQARISDSSTDLALDDSATGHAVDPRALLVQDALVQLVVRRTPFPQDPLVAAAQLPAISDGTVAVVASEEDLAIDRIVEQHDVTAMGMTPSASSGPPGVRYSRSYRLALAGQQRKREGYEGDSDEEEVFEAMEPPPPNYTCHRCGMTGDKPESHWIWECPTNDDPDHMKKVRTAKGVPRAFLQKVATIEEGQELSAGGVTFTIPGHSGHYIIAHQEASLEEKKRRVGDTVQEKLTTAFTDGAKKVEESLKCPLCHQMFRQAILAPCCGATFCSDCIIDRLAHSAVDNSCCPGCGREVLAHQLVANEDIRRQVDQITRTSKAMAIASQKQEEALALQWPKASPSTLDVDAALKDRINRPRKHATDAPGGAAARGSGELLALTDGGSSTGGSSGGGELPPPHAGAPNWQPLGLGPRLSPEQFAAWQHSVRVAPALPAIRQQFESWRLQTRQAMLPPPLPAAPPPLPTGDGAALPSKESFEAWQKMMRDSKRAERRKARSRSRSPPGR